MLPLLLSRKLSWAPLSTPDRWWVRMPWRVASAMVDRGPDSGSSTAM